jgi:hypothetical protein
VIGRISEKHTKGGMWREFVWSGGGKVRVASTAKNPKVLICGVRTEQREVAFPRLRVLVGRRSRRYVAVCKPST